MDALQGIGEIGIGSRLKRLSEYMMKDTQVVYNHFGFDFDPIHPMLLSASSCFSQ